MEKNKSEEIIDVEWSILKPSKFCIRPHHIINAIIICLGLLYFIGWSVSNLFK